MVTELPEIVVVVGKSGRKLRVTRDFARSLLADPTVTVVDADEREAPEDDLEAPDKGAPVIDVPAASATKAAWVDYACRGHGARMADARRLTKEQLIATYSPVAGATPVDESPEDGDGEDEVTGDGDEPEPDESSDSGS